MVLDIEITLNRFGFYWVSENKVQVGCFRFTVWRGLKKWTLCCEINWKKDNKNREE